MIKIASHFHRTDIPNQFSAFPVFTLPPSEHNFFSIYLKLMIKNAPCVLNWNWMENFIFLRHDKNDNQV